MKKHPKKKKNKHKLAVTPPSAYRPVQLKKSVDFCLEHQALQEIIDAALKLQTYIAMRERCQ